MKILFLSPRLPYPPLGGDKLKNYWLLKILSKYFNVHLVSIAEKNVPEDFYDWANDIRITYKIFRKAKISFYVNSMKYFFNALPLQVNYYFFKDVKKYIDSIYKEYDLLYATLVRAAKYIKDIKDKPKILDMADSLALHYSKAQRYKDINSIMWKIIYKLETNRLYKYEDKMIDKFDKTLFFNKEEMEFFNRPERCIWMPHGVDENLLSYEKKNDKYSNCMIFFGKMDYYPNIYAAKWFIKHVLFQLNKDLKFMIIGANPSKEIKKLNQLNSNIIVTGFVEDPYEIMKSSICVVAPMKIGGGIQNKVLESMALGTINIISSLAAKPIGAEHYKHFLVADNPEDIAFYINDIYDNPNKYTHLKVNSRNYIKENFTWSIYEKKLLNLIEETLNANKGKSSS